LKNLIERLVIMVEKDTIDDVDLPDAIHPETFTEAELQMPAFMQIEDFKQAKLAFEAEFIRRKLARYNHNITKTAAAIGVGRSFLHKKLKTMK
jgi:two-component system nitrogen regulation response regulator NtrX